MGYRVLLDSNGGQYWERHPHAVRWKVIEGELVLFHENSHVIIKYECTEWVKVEELR